MEVFRITGLARDTCVGWLFSWGWAEIFRVSKAIFDGFDGASIRVRWGFVDGSIWLSDLGKSFVCFENRVRCGVFSFLVGLGGVDDAR